MSVFKLFDFSLQLNGFAIGKAKLDFKHILEVPEENFEEYISKKKKQIVDFHLQNNVFYQNLANVKNAENWNNLPVLTKKNLQRPLSERLSKIS